MKFETSLLLGCIASLALTAFCAPSASTGDKGIGPSFKGPIGLQLYSLREQFKKDVPSTLDEVKSWGVKYVELAGTYDLPADKFVSMLKERGLLPIAAHFGYERFRDDAEAVALEAKALGLKYAGVAWIPHEGEFDEKAC